MLCNNKYDRRFRGEWKTSLKFIHSIRIFLYAFHTNDISIISSFLQINVNINHVFSSDSHVIYKTFYCVWIRSESIVGKHFWVFLENIFVWQWVVVINCPFDIDLKLLNRYWWYTDLYYFFNLYHIHTFRS